MNDAERYRWLRSKVCIVEKPGFMSGPEHRYLAFEFTDFPYPTHDAERPDIEFDKAIDSELVSGTYTLDQLNQRIDDLKEELEELNQQWLKMIGEAK